MSSLSKACLELSKSIKGFRFSRSPTEPSKDFVSSQSSSTSGNGVASSTAAAAATSRGAGAVHGPATTVTPSPATDGETPAADGGGGGAITTAADSVTNTISRVIRSATSRVRSLPPSSGGGGDQQRNGHGSPVPATGGGGGCTGAPGTTSSTSVAVVALKSTTPEVLTTTTTPYDIWRDEKFLAKFFRYFNSGGDLCALAQVCRAWRDVLYRCPATGVVSEKETPPPVSFWTGVTPIVNCKELPKCAAARRAYYHSIDARGFDSVCLVGAVDDDVAAIAADLPVASRAAVVHLAVRCSNVTDRGLEALLELLAGVASLELSGCNELTEAGLWTCLGVRRLVRFSVSDCINVADDTVGAVAQLLPALRELNLQAYHVTDTALALFSAKQACTLRVLRLHSCWELTNHGVLNVVRSLPSLAVLSLSGCSKITDDGVEVIAENLRQLQSLDLSWCSRITDASLEYIACDLGQLEELTLDRYVYVCVCVCMCVCVCVCVRLGMCVCV